MSHQDALCEALRFAIDMDLLDAELPDDLRAEVLNNRAALMAGPGSDD